MATSYNSLLGKRYETTTLIASGGEGEIYALSSPHQEKVIKVYTKNIDQQQTEKINKMLNFTPSQEFLKQVIWPIDLVMNKGQIQAIIMKKANGTVLNKLKNDTKYSWSLRVKIAKNFCGLLDYVHSEGQVIGDFNSNNFLIDEQSGFVTMVDSDSIHFKDTNGKIHRCPVALPEIVAPELLDVNFTSDPLPTFNQESDYWSLAIHIFQLLTIGWHPFSAALMRVNGKSLPSAASVQHKRVKNCQTPFFRKIQGFEIPKQAPDITKIFPESTIHLFEKTFISGHAQPSKRVLPKEWFDELRKLSENVKTCSKDIKHEYFGDMSECPWCAMERKQAKQVKGIRLTPNLTSSISNPKVANVRTPIKSTSTQKSRPIATMKSLSEAANLFDLDKLKKWSIGTFITSLVVSSVYLLSRQGAINLNNLFSETIEFYFPLFLLGGLLFARDKVIKNEGIQRGICINILLSIFLTIAIVYQSSINFYDISIYDIKTLWRVIVIGIYMWCTGTVVSRLLMMGMSRIKNNVLAEKRITIFEIISTSILIVGLVSGFMMKLISITGTEEWEGLYYETLPSQLKFIEDILSIKLFSIDSINLLMPVLLACIFILIILPEIRERTSKSVKNILIICLGLLGFLLMSSYSQALYTSVMLIGSMMVGVIIMVIIFGIIMAILGG